MTIKGDLIYSGDVEGSCKIDLSSTSTVDDNLMATVTVEGTFCGMDASETLSGP